MKLAILMDAFSAINPKKDTTLQLIKRALKMGWSCMTFTNADITCENAKVHAKVNVINKVEESKSNWIEVEKEIYCDLSDQDIVLMRKDPPVSLEYFNATYSLELIEQYGVFVSNKPQSLRDVNEKFIVLQFPQCCVPTLVSSSYAQLKEFWEKHKKVIFKPLYAMGGASVFYIDETGHNLGVVLEILTKKAQVAIMAQVYIPEIQTVGDKRILIIGGKAVPFALARKPKAGEHRGNLASGGSGEVVPLTSRDQWICEQISPMLIAKGLHFVGIDIIGDYLTEINVTSPTCLKEIAEVSGLDIAGMYLEYLANHVIPSLRGISGCIGDPSLRSG